MEFTIGVKNELGSRPPFLTTHLCAWFGTATQYGRQIGLAARKRFQLKFVRRRASEMKVEHETELLSEPPGISLSRGSQIQGRGQPVGPEPMLLRNKNSLPAIRSRCIAVETSVATGITSKTRQKPTSDRSRHAERGDY
jgi:hypothetical protein